MATVADKPRWRRAPPWTALTALWLRALGLCALGLSLLGPAAALAAAEPLRIGLFNPHTAMDTFWAQVESVARAAAEDLAIDLRIYRAEHDHRRQILQLERAIREDGIQAALFGDYRQNGLQLLDRAEQQRLPVLLFNTALSFDNLAKSGGGPRRRYRYWIGEMVPDEASNGYQLADQLHRMARSRGLAASDGRVSMVAISGDLSDNSSVARIRGLQRYAEIHSTTLKLNQVVNAANWSREQARFQFDRLIRRYPDVQMVWGANDPLALGALDAAAAQELPAERLVVGGMDWTVEGLAAIDAGQLEVSLGGHFLEAGWGLVLLHDYLHGEDFAPLQGLLFPTRMLPVGRARAAVYGRVLQEQRWSDIDFRRYSRVYHPELSRYPFDIRAVMDALADQ